MISIYEKISHDIQFILTVWPLQKSNAGIFAPRATQHALRRQKWSVYEYNSLSSTPWIMALKNTIIVRTKAMWGIERITAASFNIQKSFSSFTKDKNLF